MRWSRMTAVIAIGIAITGILNATGCTAWRTPLPHHAGIHAHASIEHSNLPAAAAPLPLEKPPPVAPPPPKEVQQPKDAVAPLKLSEPPKTPVSANPLLLDEVIRQLDSSFPLLLAIVQEREIAAGQRLAAEGAFDLNLRSRGTNQEGSFQNSTFDIMLEQQTLLYGLSAFGGYRLGLGDFPVYNGGRKTNQGGEFRAGFLLPLLRGGAIDPARASLAIAQINERLADPVIQRARIDFRRAAARAYWTWVGTGEQYRVAVSLQQLAEARQDLVQIQERNGFRAELDVLDNRRQVSERLEATERAEQAFQAAAIDLSLFIRDAEGNPVMPPGDRLPNNFPGANVTAPTATELDIAVREAYEARPELARFRLLAERVGVDLALARNLILPELSAGASLARDVGETKTSSADQTSGELFLQFNVPLQRRLAFGRVRVNQALQAQLTAQARFARDQIQADVQQAHAALLQATKRLTAARAEVSHADAVVVKARFQFDQGAGDLIALNFREIFAATARLKVVQALADYYRAEADLKAAIGKTE